MNSDLADSIKPLNVFSKCAEPLGRVLSNFAHTPFELDNRRFASIEAFYVFLKEPESARQKEIASLYGSHAKSAGAF